ncbi:MAG: LysM peptidoglycan-binding domain-containing protein [Bacilli bacterium]
MDCELKDNSTRSLNDELEIDILLKNNEFRSTTRQLRIDNYSYDYDDNYLILHISCVLDEGGESQMDTEENLTNDMVNKKIEPLRGELSSDEISELEELFSRKDVEVISTISDDESKKNESVEIEESQTRINQENNESTEDSKIDNRKCSCENKNELNDNDQNETVESINIMEEETIEPIILEEVIDEPLEKIDNNIEMTREESMINVVKEPNKDNMLVEEGYSIFATFYRVREGDTYSSIALKYNCNEQKLMSLNNNMELREGMLVRIPK